MRAPILLLHYDPVLRAQLRQSLEADGHRVQETSDAESGLALLRSCEEGMIVIFNVSLHRNTMAGTDGIAFLGAAIGERRLAYKHAFIILTPTPDQLDAALGRLLNHMSLPVLAEPLAMNEVLQLVKAAERRLLLTV